MKTKIISAVCTLVNEDGSLNTGGMSRHVTNQWDSGIAGILVAGTMGRMPMLTLETYRQVVQVSAEVTAGRGEVMVGVGDQSLPLTLQRIEIAQQFDAVDSLVVLTPMYLTHTQQDLIDYYRAVADVAEKPVYLYDLPQLTGNGLTTETVIELSKHPNIPGAKCSGPWATTRGWIDLLGDHFRIIPAQPFLVDELIRCGVEHNLDGIYSVFPRCTMGIVAAAEAGDWAAARQEQMRLTEALNFLRTCRYSVSNACSAIMNDLGIGGLGANLPAPAPTPAEIADLLATPVIKAMMDIERAGG